MTTQDSYADPSVAQGNWTAEAQESPEPQELATRPPEVVAETAVPDDGALMADDELAGLRARWDHVQASFVDDPRACVQQADGLVTDVVEQLTNSFTQARSHLESQWARGEEASTEDLRVALRRYRDFFDRLLAV